MASESHQARMLASIALAMEARKRTPKPPPRVVIIQRHDGVFVEDVNPETRECTGLPKQFRARPNTEGVLTLTPLSRYEWVEDPEVIMVSEMRLG